MTEDDEMCFKLMDKCHICDKKYTDKETIVTSLENSEAQLTKTVT